EAELDRQALALCLDDGTAVLVEVVLAPLELVRPVPQLPRLREVVDVLGESDLVHAPLRGSLDEALDPGDREVELLLRIAKVHVIVDDHNSAATRSRSTAAVTLSNRGSPGTTFTRPPMASTSDEQSLAAEMSPASAWRSVPAAKAYGVWTATSEERSSVS